MNSATWLHKSTAKLSAAGIDTARLDSLVLLEDTIGKDRAWILAHPEHVLTPDQLAVLDKAIRRRVKHEPLAYIRGRTEFYGRTFVVSPNVLVPRPESENLITLLDQAIQDITDEASLSLVDIGTGSGCLAITAALEHSGISVIATDSSSRALAVAKQNAKLHKAEIAFYNGDLIDALPKIPDTAWGIIANLPYVPDNFPINHAAEHEPAEALFAGIDGLDDYRVLFLSLNKLTHKPRFVVCESLPNQHGTLQQIALSATYQLSESADFGQYFVLDAG